MSPQSTDASFKSSLIGLDETPKRRKILEITQGSGLSSGFRVYESMADYRLSSKTYPPSRSLNASRTPGLSSMQVRNKNWKNLNGVFSLGVNCNMIACGLKENAIIIDFISRLRRWFISGGCSTESRVSLAGFRIVCLGCSSTISCCPTMRERFGGYRA